ncbi:hypothetical protein QUB29_26410 [Microcoleus sp. B4b_D2]|uniref:hypothetical protein n=1 Tax=Microcoleus sp. B4b_D2 TaxID=3055310 RepID=UPI002FD004B4
MTTTSPRLSDLTREEANTLTDQIKENFDSLGNMLLAARDRKAYKVIGYSSFESYCQSEFGKSASAAYEAIEVAKVRSQLEAHIAENYGESITLNVPSSHFRPLRAVEGLDNKLKAIEYANKLAEGEGKKVTKQHIEIAVFEMSGKRSEDFRGAIQKLGFAKGTPVEVRSPIKKERGIVTKVDKLGKIHVELYYGSNKAKEYDATQLRILSNNEKPTSPLEGSVAAKGDRVLIFAEGLQGKKGVIYSWKEGKTALVKIDGREKDSPISIAYAEMELLKENEPKNATWNSELVWNVGKNTYYFIPQQSTIYSDKWPHNLSIQTPPDPKENSPAQFMKVWEEESLNSLLESFMTPARTKTLALAQAIELPEQQGKEFVTDLIASLNQLFPQVSKPPKAMGISFSRTINELTSGRKTQTRRAWQDDYAKNFIRYFDENIAIPALDKGRHRGGCELGFIKLTQRPYQQYLSEMSPTDLQEEGGMVATTQEFIDTYFEGQDKLVWVLHFEFLATINASNADTLVAENQQLRERLAEAEAAIEAIVNTACTASPLASSEVVEFLLKNTPETSTPGDTAAHPDFLLENNSEIASPGDTAAHFDSWKELLASNGFIPVPYQLEGFFKGHWRGWNFFFHSPNGGAIAIDIANEKEEMFTRCTEVDFDIDLNNEEAIVNWVRGVINKVEDFCPGQLALDLDTGESTDLLESAPAIQSIQSLKQDINSAITTRKKKTEDELEELTQELLRTKNEKKIQTIRADIRTLETRLKDIANFVTSRIGDSVIRNKFPEKKGIIEKLDVSVTGLPTAWVMWPQEYEEEPNSPQEHTIGTLTNLSSASRGEK